MASLKFDLDVIGSTCIRRRKPWPRLSIVGESVFLLDAQRISILYMKSGKTKRKLAKFQPLLKNVVQMAASDRGDFIGGLMNSGDLFLWHKMTDTLKHIHGEPLLVNAAVGLQRTGSRQFPYLCIASSLILVVTETCQIYVWELDPNTSFFSPGQPTLPGTWAQVFPEVGSELPNPSNTELSVHAVFSINAATLGLHCFCSFVFFRNGDLCITTVAMQWSSEEPVLSCRKPTFSAKWKTLTIQMANIGALIAPVLEPGAIVARNSCDGQLLAIAVNQLNSQANRLAYVSFLSEVTTVVDLKAMGTRMPITKNAKSYWIKDMAWSCDDLFVVCITGQGSVCLLPRLGEPVIIATHGFSIDMGPKYFLPIHPLISIETGNEEDSTKLPSNSSLMRQHFSVAVHPKLPIFLFSDGFMVTAVELSQDVTCLTLLRQLSSLSTSHLSYIRKQQKLHLSLFETFKLARKFGASTPESKHSFGVRRGLMMNGSSSKPRTPYTFEDAPLDAADDDGFEFERMTGRNGFAGHNDFGRIVFGDEENTSTSVDVRNHMEENGQTVSEYLLSMQKEVVLAWGLAASHIGIWTTEHEEATNIVAHNLVKFCTILLETDMASQAESGKKSSPELTRVLLLFKQVTSLLCMDMLGKKLLVSYTRFVHSIIELLLRTKALKRSRVHALNGCCLVLRYAERHLAKIYSLVTDESGIVNPLCSLLGGISSRRSKFFPLENSLEDNGKFPVLQNHPCWKRLCGSWQMLFRYIVKHYDFVRQQFESQSEPRRSLRVQLEQTTEVLLTVIGKLQKLNPESLFTVGPRLLPAELFSIEGRKADAMTSWVQTIESHYNDDGSGDVCRCLHAILYALILDGNIRGAMELVELIVREPNTSKAVSIFAENGPSKASALSQIPKSGEERLTVFLPFPLISSRAVRHLMLSLGRIMAAYFTNITLFIFPPHDAVRIPPLCSAIPVKRRILMLPHDVITQKMTSQHLDPAWTVQKSLQYLLLGCCPCDAVWMVHRLGDWKTAFVMASAVNFHHANAASDYARLKLNLPSNLKPEIILTEHIMSILREFSRKEDLPIDTEFLAQSLSDSLLAATFAGVDLACVVLTFLIQTLKDVVKQLKPVVPDGVYLPAPPVYCPQPVITQEERSRLSEAELVELQLRRRASVIVNLIVLVMNSSLVVQPSVRWYAAKVMKAVEIQAGLEGVSLESDSDSSLRKYLSLKSVFNRDEEKLSVGIVLASFRDLSSLLWLMEIRDKLSLLLRKKRAEIDNQIIEASASHNEIQSSICQDALQWSTYLLPFSAFLDAENDICGTVLSLIAEMPASASMAKILARHFPKVENFDAKIQEKLQLILKEWQGTFLTDRGSSSNLTMNLVYREELAKIARSNERKRAAFHAFDEYVFANEDNSLEIGSRPFESLMKYANFIGMFFDVCLGKALESANLSKRNIPLLKEYSADIRKKELSSMPKRVSSRLSRDTVSISNPVPLKHPLPAKRKLDRVKSLVEVPESDIRQVGLFRSRSTGDVAKDSGKHITRSSSVTFSRAIDEDSAALPDLDFLISNISLEHFGTDRQRNRRHLAANRNNNSSNLKQSIRDFQRATSLLDQETFLSTRDSDVLSRPLVPSSILEKMKFDAGFSELERLIEWLSLWAGHASVFNDITLFNSSASSGVHKPVMQVQVSPRLLIYSLWLIDNIETTKKQSFLATEQEEITVAMVQEVETVPGKNSRTEAFRTDREKLKNRSDKNFVPNPVRRSQSFPLGKTLGSYNENGNGLTKESSDDDEFERIAAQNTKHKFDDSDKKNNKILKKSNSKLSDDPREKIFERDSEQLVISYDTQVSDFGTERLSLVEQDQVRHVQETLLSPGSARTDSESSLAVSSLTGDDLHQTMKDTLMTLAGKKNPTTSKDTDNISEAADEVQVVNVPQQQSSFPSQHQQHVQPDMASDLRLIIRDEMRRIMAAQHQGILAMLNSLDPNEGSRVQLTMNDTPLMNVNANAIPNGHAVGFSRPVVPNQYAVYRVEADNPTFSKESFPDSAEKTTTTPILSNSKLEKLKEDSPLKFTDLMKTDDRNSRPNPGIQDALLELKLLRNESGPRPFLLTSNLDNGSVASFNPLRHQPFAAATKDSEEFNRKMFPPIQMFPPLLRPPVPERQLAYRLHLPEMFRMEYRRPNEILNREIPGSSFPVMRQNYFIREPPDRDVGIINAVPPAFVARNAQSQMNSFAPPVMPPLDLRRPTFQARMPFPLLRLPNAPQQEVRPFFVFPPDQGSKSDQVHFQDNAGAPQSSREVVEPSDEIQTTNLNTDREGDLTEFPLDSQRRPVSEVSKEKLDAGISLDEEPVKLHSGYALTPGMFDEYLAKQNELGSASDSNAKIQYEAVVALQPKPKAEIVLKKDMYTETDENDHTSDFIGETVQRYIRDQKDRRTDPILPPDVFMQLKFAEKDQEMPDAKGIDWKRDFINVVDINNEMLSDIMSTVRDKQSRSRGAVREETPAKSVDRSLEAPAKVSFQEPAEGSASRGPDAITVDLFNQISSDVSLSRLKGKHQSKTTIDGMNQRITEIAKMAQNMQRDFADTRLVVNKLEEIGERLQKPKSARKQEEDDRPSNLNQSNFSTDELHQTNDSRISVEELFERTLESGRKGVDISQGELQELFSVLSARSPRLHSKQDEDDERKKLLKWMETKRAERMRNFRDQLQDKRSSEAHPFESKRHQTVQSQRTLEAFEGERAAKKKKIQMQNMEQRTQEMAGLLNEMLSDQQLLSKTFVAPAATTAKTTVSGQRPRPSFDITRTGKAASSRPKGKTKPAADDHREYLELLNSCEREAEQILKQGSARNGTSRTEESNFLRADSAYDETARTDDSGMYVGEEANANIANKTFRLKSFREVVKLQRPELTRQKRPHFVKRTSSALGARASTARSNNVSLTEKQRIYGSNRVRSAPRPMPTVRTIKTYTQRLQEMKQNPTDGKNNIRWRYTTGGEAGQPTLVQPQLKGSGQKRTKPRLSLTYAQQLQQLQAPKEQYYSNNESTSLKQSTSLKWHKPLHASKTYSEQLKELQQPASIRLENIKRKAVSKPTVYDQTTGQIGRSQRRSRPYADPYSDLDAASETSGWSVDDNLRKILYGNRSPQITTASDTDLSELIAQRDMESPFDYTDLVNIEDLEMLDSVSINSCIDWEAVDQMVADID